MFNRVFDNGFRSNDDKQQVVGWNSGIVTHPLLLAMNSISDVVGRFMSGMDIVSRFGASVRDLRRRMGISQEALAERADLHRTYVAGIEGGVRNVTLKVVDKLAKALQVPPATLLSGEVLEGNGHSRPRNQSFVEILLAENNPDDVQTTLLAFKETRFVNSVHVVHDGQETLDYLFCQGKYAARRLEDRPKLLLLDLDLPKLSGLEVLRRIKADKRTGMIPVVVLTNSQKHHDIAECRRLGTTYVLKPLDLCRLTEVTPDLNLDWGLLEPSAPSRPGK